MSAIRAERSAELAPAGIDPPGPTSNRPGVGAWKRLRQNRVACVFAFVFLVIVVLCLLAPVYAKLVAHTGPNQNHISERIVVGRRLESIVSPIGIPLGPTWHARFFLGADQNGRDVAVRLLYGGRTSLEIGGIATLITVVMAVVVGLPAGYFGGAIDGAISRLLEVIWAYPAVLLGVALGVSLELGGLSVGPIHLHSGSVLLPALVIGVVYIPYVAKPLRGQVLQTRDRDFVAAARIAGMSHVEIMMREILPNVASTIIVFIPLTLANAILLEAGLSFLGAGVQDPNPSWGTMISDGIQLVPSAFHLVLAPGIVLVLAVTSINVLGDAVRDAMDPKATRRQP